MTDNLARTRDEPSGLVSFPVGTAHHAAESARKRSGRLPQWLRRYWSLVAFVLVPTLLAALYLVVIDADQYESDAVFVVRGTQSDGPRGGSLTELLGIAGGGSPAQAENRSIGQYLLSHDALKALKAQQIDLVAVFRRAEADPISRLWYADPTAETLLDYYRDHVFLTYDPDDGMTRLQVRAFRRDDALAIASALLKLGENRINTFNKRALDTVMSASNRDVATAENDLATIQRRLTRFREGRRDIDPRANAAGTQELVGTLEAQLAQARAQSVAMTGVLSAGSPQLAAINARIRGLQSQLGALSGRLTGASASIAPRLADYEELLLRQSFAAKRYDAARTAQQVARNQAIRQQLFVVAVVEPNLPEKSLYPRRFATIASIFAGLLVAWGIGWLLLAGIREHAE
jgi:capsular polysaccharide transport system permease protein